LIKISEGCPIIATDYVTEGKPQNEDKKREAKFRKGRKEEQKNPLNESLCIADKKENNSPIIVDSKLPLERRPFICVRYKIDRKTWRLKKTILFNPFFRRNSRVVRGVALTNCKFAPSDNPLLRLHSYLSHTGD